MISSRWAEAFGQGRNRPCQLCRSSCSHFPAFSVLLILLLLFVHPADAAVNLIYPQDGSWINYVVFQFNHTMTGAATCTLSVDGVVSGTYSNVPPNESYTATTEKTFAEGKLLLWNVSCTRDTLTQTSPLWTFAIDREPPNVTASAADSETPAIVFQYFVTDNSDNWNCSLFINNVLNQTTSQKIGAFTVTPLSGAVVWSVACQDKAGNVGSSLPAIVSANDTTPPAIYLDTPENGSIANKADQTLLFVAFDNSSSSYCSLYLDGALTGQGTDVPTTPLGGYGQFKAEGLAVGAHNWSVRCADKIGHEGRSAVSYFTVDPTAPFMIVDTPKILVNSPDPLYKQQPSVTLEYTPYDSRHNTMNCSIYIDGALADSRIAYHRTKASATFDSSISGYGKFIADGRHVWQAGCTDAAGNIGNSKQAVYVIDTSGVSKPIEQPLWFTLSGDALIWSGIIIGIAALLLGAAFMASKVFMVPAWEAWVREEFGNLLFTAFILVAFVTFAYAIEFVADSLARDVLFSSNTNSYWRYIYECTPGADKWCGRWDRISVRPTSCPYPCHVYIARGFLGSVYEDYGASITSTAKALAVSRLFESFGLSVGLDVVPWAAKLYISFGIPLYPGRAVFNNSLSKALDELLRMSMGIKAQEVMLGYLPGLSGIFFITGVLFRIPWFTRKLGGLLVALAIGLYAILPLVYVLAWYTVDRSSVTFNEQMLSEDLTEVEFGELASTLGGKTSVASLFTNYDGSGKEVQIGLLDMVGRAYLINTLIPVLAIFATIGFVRHFSPMIGGDVEIAGLTRII